MNNKLVKTIIQLVLLVVIIVVAYLIYDGINTPIKFEKEKKRRCDATIARLIDIRTIQVSYKDVYGDYSDKFDELIRFVKEGNFPVVRKVGTTPEELIDSLGIEEAELVALEKGLIKRDTIPIPVLDSLFSSDYPIDSIRYVPFCGSNEFQIGKNQVKTASMVVVPVFEVKVSFDVLLHDMNKQLIINLKDEKEQINQYPGLKVGDLNIANNNAGNWE